MILTDSLNESQSKRLYEYKRKVARPPNLLTDSEIEDWRELVSLMLKPLFTAGRPMRFLNKSISDLCNFERVRSKTVIDFIVLEIHTQRPTNFQTIRRAIKLESCYVKPLADDTNSCFRFAITIHDISKFKQLQEVIKRINDKCPLSLNIEPKISVIEVAHDFYGQPPAFLVTLTQSLIIDIGTNKLNIRFYKEKSHELKFGLMPASNACECFERGYVLGIGHRDSGGQIKHRAYYKRTDQGVELEQSKHRCRIEVTMKCNEPINNLGGLVKKAVKHLKFYQLNDELADNESRHKHAFIFQPKSKKQSNTPSFKFASSFNKRLSQSGSDLLKTLRIN